MTVRRVIVSTSEMQRQQYREEAADSCSSNVMCGRVLGCDGSRAIAETNHNSVLESCRDRNKVHAGCLEQKYVESVKTDRTPNAVGVHEQHQCFRNPRKILLGEG